MDLPPLDSLISAKEAAKRFGYSPDYVAKLARKQDVVGRRVGHAWFVDPSSLEVYASLSDQEKAERAVELAHVRHSEYHDRAEVQAPLPSAQSQHVASRERPLSKSVALLAALAILAGTAALAGPGHFDSAIRISGETVSAAIASATAYDTFDASLSSISRLAIAALY